MPLFDAHCHLDQLDDPDDAVRRAVEWLPLDGQDRGYWSWMNETFGLSDPYAMTR